MAITDPPPVDGTIRNASLSPLPQEEKVGFWERLGKGVLCVAGVFVTLGGLAFNKTIQNWFHEAVDGKRVKIIGETPQTIVIKRVSSELFSGEAAPPIPAVPKETPLKINQIWVDVVRPVKVAENQAGEVTRGNIAGHIQTILDETYGQPVPLKDDVVVTHQGVEKKWKELTNQEKYDALYEHSLPHNRPKLMARDKFENDEDWASHLDGRLFRGSHKADGSPNVYLPNDPKRDHGSDHAVRVSLYSAVFGAFYNKYHPDVTLTEDDMLTIQLVGTMHDGKRQTEGVDIDDERSAAYAGEKLEQLGFAPGLVREGVAAIHGKDNPDLAAKHVIAKCVQCADSAEYIRLFGGYQAPSEFEKSGGFLDIMKEFKAMNESGAPLKGGQTFEEFKADLDETRREMNKLILATHNQEARVRFSAAGKNYYQELLSQVNPATYPKLHAILSESGVIPEAVVHPVASQTISAQAATVPKPVAVTEQLQTDGQLFPQMLTQIQVVNASIGGTTGAKLVQDKQGNKYVQKTTGTKIKPNHLKSEYYTNKAYKALGVPVPEVALYHSVTSARIAHEDTTSLDKPVMLSKFIPGKHQELGKFLGYHGYGQDLIPDRVAIAQNIMKQHFVADCLLANWDVIGFDYDNVLIDENNVAWRIDNGAGMDYRAQGAMKPESAFTDHIQEFTTLRNPTINDKGALLYATLTDKEIIQQIDDILPRREAFLAAIPDHLKAKMTARFNYLTTYRAQLVAK